MEDTLGERANSKSFGQEKEEYEAIKFLVEMGFHEDQVSHAIKACGNYSSVGVLVDFIQAHYGPAGAAEQPVQVCSEHEEFDVGRHSNLTNVTEAENSPDYVQTDVETQLLKMGFSVECISSAIEACGRESSIFEISDFIQAHFGITGEEDRTPLFQNVEVDDATGYAQKDVKTQLPKMGFSEEHVSVAIEACGKESSVCGFSNFIQTQCGITKQENGLSLMQGAEMDEESSSKEGEDGAVPVFKKLKQMGFTEASVERAARDLGSLDFEELVGYLIADGAYSSRSSEYGSASTTVERNWQGWSMLNDKKQDILSSSESDEENSFAVPPCGRTPKLKPRGVLKRTCLKGKQDNLCSPPNYRHMTGFGVPGHFVVQVPRKLNELMEGPPYFYFENVAHMPDPSCWETIVRHFHGVEPEFVDSKYFAASMRPRGYVHNLPTQGRKLIITPAPMTIEEALPDTRAYWPSWDHRKKLNCIMTRRASDVLCNKVRTIVRMHEGRDLPLEKQQWILKQRKIWNLVWVGPGQVAPLEPHEIELFLGYDHEHTRGSSTMTERYEALGNSFQVNTVAYHLSPLNKLYPRGINVLSLFAGIGGAEVALHNNGMFLKTVVSIEIKEKNRNVLDSWWRRTNQRGRLIVREDVRSLTPDVLSDLIDDVGGFDLIIGGIPCNNFSGNNRVTRVGLQGEESCLFYEFPRILNIVKLLMYSKQTR